MKRLALLAVLATLVSTLGVTFALPAPPAGASHLRGNQITWHRTAPTTAEFHVSGSWRCGYFFSTPCNATVGAVFNPETLYFGDGTSDSGPWTVTAVDVANDVVSAERHVAHTYPTAGPYVAAIDSGARLQPPQHINNPSGSYRFESIVDLAKTSASPVSTIPPIVDCALNATCQFGVPGFDADGGTLKWRLSTASEAGSGFVQPGPPYATNAATVNATTGLYSWNTTGAQLNTSGSGDTFYSTQVTIEDVVGGVVVSKTPVDFFIRLTTSPNKQPVFVPNTPADGTVFNVAVGQNVTFATKATDPDTGDTVTLGMLGKPAAATYTTVAGNPATGTFSFTPTVAGTTLLNLTAVDQQGLGATVRSITINAAASNAPPIFVAPTPASGTTYIVAIGQNVTFGTSATDPDTGQNVTLGITNKPAAATYTTAVGNPANGTFTFTSSTAGTFTFTLTATDPAGAAASPRTITINVANRQPVFTSPTPAETSTIFAKVGSPLTINVRATDPDAGHGVTTSASVLPPGATYTPTNGNPATGVLSFKPTAPATHAVTLDAVDTQGFAAVPRRFTIKVLVPTKLEVNPAIVEVDSAITPSVLYFPKLSATLTIASGVPGAGTPLPNQRVTFSVGGKTLCSALTNSAGLAKCGALANYVGVAFNLGYEGSYAGDTTYSSSTGSAPLAIVVNADVVNRPAAPAPTPAPGPTAPLPRTPGDYDGDGDTDLSVWRPATGTWFVQPDTAGVVQGAAGAIPVPGSYDGDGKTDKATFRDGSWYIFATTPIGWGTTGDIPVPGDYNGDSITDVAVYRPSTGFWYVRGGTSLRFGVSTDIPVPGDYDGDGDTDMAVWRPSTGVLYIVGGPGGGTVWGQNGDVPVQGDYVVDAPGQRKTEFAVWRPSTGAWFVMGGGPALVWGAPGDRPVPADYNGDGKVEPAVYRRSSTGGQTTWFAYGGQTGTLWGYAADMGTMMHPAVRAITFGGQP